MMTSTEIICNLINYMESVSDTCDFTNISKEDCKQIVTDLNRLEKLEKIEKELGIDLVTLFKALKNGVYVANDEVNSNHKCFVGLAYKFDEIKRWSLLGFAYGYEASEWLFLKDYGKTWALTKGEL